VLNLLLFVVVVGLICWLITLLPLPAPFAKIVIVLGVILVVARILAQLFGISLLGGLR
jgi:hypothetical protein